MNTFSSWSYLRTRVVTGEGDSILCVGTQLPEEVIGNIDVVANTDSLPEKKYDLILGETQLKGIYRLKDHFDKISRRLKSTGIYALAEPIVGSEDAWANTLLSTLDPSHVRAPRVEEVVFAAAETFELTEFLRFSVTRRFRLPEGPALENIETQLKSFPENVTDRLSPSPKDGELVLNQLTGLFVWQK